MQGWVEGIDASTQSTDVGALRASELSYLVTAMRTVRTEYFLTIGEIVEEYERNGSDVLPALFNAFWMARFEPYVREDRSAYPRLRTP